MSGFAAEAQGVHAEYPLTYEGGSLPLSRDKVKAALGQDEVIFVQNRRRISVPAKDITRISCRSEVRRRFGATVLDVVPWLRLGEVENRYVGVTWTDSARTSERDAKVEVVLRMSKSDYDGFLAGLERLTGMKAVDTTRVPTAVRYGL
jgi:hypothetical protein